MDFYFFIFFFTIILTSNEHFLLFFHRNGIGWNGPWTLYKIIFTVDNQCESKTEMALIQELFLLITIFVVSGTVQEFTFTAGEHNFFHFFLCINCDRWGKSCSGFRHDQLCTGKSPTLQVRWNFLWCTVDMLSHIKGGYPFLISDNWRLRFTGEMLCFVSHLSKNMSSSREIPSIAEWFKRTESLEILSNPPVWCILMIFNDLQLPAWTNSNLYLCTLKIINLSV